MIISGNWSCLSLDNSAKSTLTVAPMGFAMTSLNLFANALLMGLRLGREKIGTWRITQECCVRKSNLLECYKRETNKFLPLTNVKLPDSSVVLGVKSLGSCGSACLGNCSCMGYAHEESSDQCLIWSEEHVLNLQQLEGNNGEGSTFYLRLMGFGHA